MATGENNKLQLALLGTGIFARDAYLGILRSMASSIELRFIWSRSQEGAEKFLALAHDWAPAAEPVWGEPGLQKIFGCPEVHCCAVVLPIKVQPEVVMRALQAGKHVIQGVAVGMEMLAAHRLLAQRLPPHAGRAPIWAVAENFRFEKAFHE
eukprot:jgi/Mesen1/9416/ME000614S08672